MRKLPLWLVLFVTLTCCSFESGVDPTNTYFKCDTSNDCPQAFECLEKICRPISVLSDVQEEVKVSTDGLVSDTNPLNQGDAEDKTDSSQQDAQVSPVDIAATSDASGNNELPPQADTNSNPCGEVTSVGCCLANKAFSCSQDQIQEVDCTLAGGVCGWMGAFYGCDSEGLEAPDGVPPYTCPGETCVPNCDDGPCTLDGCGGLCACGDLNAECVDGACSCKEGAALEEDICCPEQCTNGCEDGLCEIDCNQNSPYCEGFIQCPPGLDCEVKCNKANTCSMGVTSPKLAGNTIIDCAKDSTCMGPIELLGPGINTVECSNPKSCRKHDPAKDFDGFNVDCSGQECTVSCPKGSPGAADGQCNGPITCSAEECVFNCTGKNSCGDFWANDAASPTLHCAQEDIPDSSCTVICGSDEQEKDKNACKGLIRADHSKNVSIECLSKSSCAAIEVHQAESAYLGCLANDSCKQTGDQEQIGNRAYLGAQSSYVRCLGTNSCTSTTLNGAVSISESAITANSCPNGAHSCMECSAANTCSNVKVVDSGVTNVSCDESNSCSGSLSCFDGASSASECIFECKGDQSCKNFTCDNMPSCVLQCTGQNSCTQGSYSCLDSQSCTLLTSVTQGQVATNKSFRTNNMSADILSPPPCNLLLSCDTENPPTGCTMNPGTSCCYWCEEP